MPAGWFDAFRENGAPTWYGENRTPVVTDTETAAIAVIFGLLFMAFLLIFPGVRRERTSSFVAVTLNLLTGSVILVCLHHPCWERGCVHLVAPYRSFSSERINAYLGMKVGLSAVNITLTGSVEGRHHSNFSYNERFVFTEVRSMQEELRKGLKKGLPYPILSAIQYLSVDKAGFSWGRGYRLAGYYTSCLLWLCFSVWLLGLVLMCLVPHAYPPCLFSLGSGMCLSVIVYRFSSPAGLQIPFPLGNSIEPSFLVPYLHWCFWLTLANGLLCLTVGAVLWLCAKQKIYKFATFFQVDLDDMLTPPESQFDYRQLAGNGPADSGSSRETGEVMGLPTQNTGHGQIVPYTAKKYSSEVAPASGYTAVETRKSSNLYVNSSSESSARKRHQFQQNQNPKHSVTMISMPLDQSSGSSSDSSSAEIERAAIGSLKCDSEPQLADNTQICAYSSAPTGVDRIQPQHRKLRSRRSPKKLPESVDSATVPAASDRDWQQVSFVTNPGPIVTGSTSPSRAQDFSADYLSDAALQYGGDVNGIVRKPGEETVHMDSSVTKKPNGVVQNNKMEDIYLQNNAGSQSESFHGGQAVLDRIPRKLEDGNSTRRFSNQHSQRSPTHLYMPSALELSAGSAYHSTLEPDETSGINHESLRQNPTGNPIASIDTVSSFHGSKNSFNLAENMNLSPEGRNFHERFPVPRPHRDEVPHNSQDSLSTSMTGRKLGDPALGGRVPDSGGFRLHDLSSRVDDWSPGYRANGGHQQVGSRRKERRLSSPTNTEKF